MKGKTDSQKIDFILCCNNDFYIKECRMYLEELEIPDGFQVGTLEIRGAASMTAGYNEGMEKSDAKYKIYMHQDVFITNKHFLKDILSIFMSTDEIGMIGMVGTPYMVKSGTMWQGVRYGGFYKLEERLAKGQVKRFFPICEGYMEVEAIDGLLMATQYDIPWRDDLFQKWDFYDVSQSFEFLKAGYKVVVPGQQRVWYLHDCGVINLEYYDGERKKFLQEYSSYMRDRKEQKWEEYLEVVKEKIEEGYRGNAIEKEQLITRLEGLKDEEKKK